jgi:hypothetical protein
MKYPDDANGDVFRRLEESGFDFSAEHVVDFFSVYASESEADQVAQMYLADHKAGDSFTNIETRPHHEGGMELTLSRKMHVTYEAITRFEQQLAERACMAGGSLDGWGVLQE